MRRIPITSKIETIAKRYALELEGLKNENPKTRLLDLSKKLRKSSASIRIPIKGTKKHVIHKGNKFTAASDYVKAIHDHYEGLNSLLPSEYAEKISKHVDPELAGYDVSEIKVKLPQKRLQPLFELIVDAMRYAKVQKDIMPKYIKEMGIKTCSYCNAQFTTTALIQEIKYAKKGKFDVKTIDASCYELDHNKAKSVYPYLCTNFYNLQPSCSSCNRRKNNRELDFSLYYEVHETDIKPVHFALAPDDLINFRINNQCKGVKANLCNEGTDFPPSIQDNTSKAGKMNHMLGIQGIYDEYDDVVEEILWKHKIYSRGFMTATKNQIKSLGIAGFDMKRFVLGGYYTYDDDFLKRPLSILKNDLWEQLNKTSGDTKI